MSSIFHENLLFIKKQIEKTEHPLNKIITHFRKVFQCQYELLLMKNGRLRLHSQQAVVDDFATAKEITRENMNALKKEVKGFIDAIVSAVLKFYEIKLGPRDIKRDMMVNVLTNVVVKEEIYIIIFNNYSKYYDEDIQKMHAVQHSNLIQDKYLGFEALNTNSEFQMNPEYRESFPLKNVNEV